MINRTQEYRQETTSLIEEALSLGRKVTIRARGGSMRPLIPDGSHVELVPPHRSPQIGDVIAARRGDALVVHRVISVNDGIRLKGDGSPQADHTLQPDEPIIAFASRVVTPRGWTMRLDTPGAALVGYVAAWLSKQNAD